MAICKRVILRMVQKMAAEFKLGLMVIAMKAICKIIQYMEKELSNFQMDRPTKDNSVIMNNMAKECSLFKMEESRIKSGTMDSLFVEQVGTCISCRPRSLY